MPSKTERALASTKNTFARFTTLSPETLRTELSVGAEGLASDEARKRLERHGRNEISAKTATAAVILGRQFRSSFVWLLLIAALIAIGLGEFIDGGMIILFVAINTLLGFYQEYHSEKTIQLLRQYTVPACRLKRNGQSVLIPAPEIVPGDTVLLEAGDVIPADVRFVADHDLVVDESMLTGESVPVPKNAQASSRPVTEIYQAANIGFSGTSVVSGHAEAQAIGTGRETVLGSLAHLATETKRESTFEKGLGKFSSFILRLIVLTLVFVFIANLFLKKGSVSVIELAIFSVALAVSVIPEALPAVTTFSLSRGALRLAKNQVVAKRLSAIEDLGSIEVLCTDKTGTLTRNQLQVAELYSAQPNVTLLFACLASSDATHFKTRQPNNAFDLAIWERLADQEQHKLDSYQKVEDIPFDPERRRNSVLVERAGQYILIVRGAPETLIEFSETLLPENKKALERWTQEQGRRGRRVIAVATKSFAQPKKYTAVDEETGLKLNGLISFVDPIKLSTFAAIKKARQLGVKIKILTGDSKEVAGAVAHEIGLISSPDMVMTGAELAGLTPTEQLDRMDACSVFARVSPQEKYQIIQLLEQRHEVGFLGEGINDAPALKIANVALVVQGAADIAREASDLVLLKQSLEVIIDGIREGREIFANTIKYLKVTLASNFGNFFAIAVASLLIDFLPMLPLQILLLNLLSDFPMIAIATDANDSDELKRPKVYDVREVALVAGILGVVSSLFDFIFFAIFSRTTPAMLYTYWFIGSVLTELALIFCLRTRFPFWRARRPSRTLVWLGLIAALAAIIIPALSFGQNIFKFIRPEWSRLWLVFGLVAAYFVVSEIVKLMYYRFHVQPKRLPATS